MCRTKLRNVNLWMSFNFLFTIVVFLSPYCRVKKTMKKTRCVEFSLSWVEFNVEENNFDENLPFGNMSNHLETTENDGERKIISINIGCEEIKLAQSTVRWDERAQWGEIKMLLMIYEHDENLFVNFDLTMKMKVTESEIDHFLILHDILYTSLFSLHTISI